MGTKNQAGLKEAARMGKKLQAKWNRLSRMEPPSIAVDFIPDCDADSGQRYWVIMMATNLPEVFPGHKILSVDHLKKFTERGVNVICTLRKED